MGHICSFITSYDGQLNLFGNRQILSKKKPSVLYTDSKSNDLQKLLWNKSIT